MTQIDETSFQQENKLAPYTLQSIESQFASLYKNNVIALPSSKKLTLITLITLIPLPQRLIFFSHLAQDLQYWPHDLQYALHY